MSPGHSMRFPNPPGSHGVFVWHFALNTDDSTDPPGFPFPSGQMTAPAEFGVDALWDGKAFRGLLLQRSAASADGWVGLAVPDSGKRLGARGSPSLCPQRWLRGSGQRLCCPAQPGIASRSGLMDPGGSDGAHQRRRDRATALAPVICSAFWIAV